MATKIIVRKDNKDYNNLSPIYRYGKIDYEVKDWQKEIILKRENIDKNVNGISKLTNHWDDKNKLVKIGAYPETQEEIEAREAMERQEKIKNNLPVILDEIDKQHPELRIGNIINDIINPQPTTVERSRKAKDV